jgi:hypothetical protein
MFPSTSLSYLLRWPFTLALWAAPLTGLVAADLQNDRYQLTLTTNGAVQVSATNVSPKTLRPEFTVQFRSTKPTFQYAEWPYPYWSLYGSTNGALTTDPFLTGATTILQASQAQVSGTNLVWTFPAQANFSLTAQVSLGAGAADPLITYTFASKTSGWFTVAYTGAPELPPAQIDDVPQPATQYSSTPGYAFPDSPGLKQEHLCQLPLVMLSSAGENFSLLVDPDFMPWRLAHQYNSIFGVCIRNEAGNAQPLVFAPMMGSDASQFTNTETFTFALRFVARPGYWSDAYRYMARNLYGFQDNRDNSGPGSINDVIASMVHYVMDKSGSNYAMWSDEQKFNDYWTDQPGAYKLLSPLYGIGAAIMLDDEEFYRRRALPMIEYALSREHQTFYPFQTNWLGGVETNRNMNGPNIESDSLGVLYGLSQERSTAFRSYGLQQTGVTRSYAHFPDVLEYYRLSGDPADLNYAIAGANYCIANNLIGNDYPSWLEIYKETGDTNYLAAAGIAARNYEPSLNVSPRVPTTNITVDPNNEAPIHWQTPGRWSNWGFPTPQPMSAPEQSVPAWRPALTGLQPQPPYRGFTFVHYAPGLLRLSRHLNDDFIRDLARWALVGRWGNFPGEIFSRDYSAVYEQTNYCEHPIQYMTFTSMHYGHPWMYLSWALDFLVSDTFHHSAMQIDFPNRRVRSSFPCNIYGDRPGVFYGETNVNLWLPVGLLSGNNRQVNYLSAYGNGKLYLALVNQSFSPETFSFTLNSNLVSYGATHSAAFWQENVLQSPATITNGSVTVQIAAKGIAAFAINGISVQPRLQQKLFDRSIPQTPPSSLVKKTGPYGKLVGMFISMGRDLAEAYVYTDALPENITQARLYYTLGAGWTNRQDLCFPYEFSLPVNAAQPYFKGTFYGTLTNGQEVVIGELELPGDPQLYVDASAGTGGDGTSWATAFTNLDTALQAAMPGNQVWVRSGTYLLTNTLQIPGGVQLYGGFAGTETNVAQRSTINQTILRQSISGIGVAAVNAAGNVRLDGFTLTGATNVSGGGAGLFLYQARSNVVIANCRITGNSDSAVDGAGAGMRLTGSTPVMLNCEISGNYCPRPGSTGGGGVYFDSTSGGWWTNCVISGNKTLGDLGGGLDIQCSDGSGPTFVNSTICNNESGKNGGGVYGKGDLSFINCRFVGNQIRTPGGNGNGGGGLYCYNTGSEVLLDGCILSGNQVGTTSEVGAGGGLFVGSLQTLTLRNSIVSGNYLTGASSSRGAGVHVASSANIANVTANNCTIADNLQAATGSAGGFNNVNSTANTVFLWNTVLANNSQLARNGTTTEDHNLYFGNGTDGTPVGNPRFVSDGTNALTGTWAAVGSFAANPLTGRGTTLLTVSGTPFVPGALAGRLLNPKTSQKRQAYILDNTANTITAAGDLAGSYGVLVGDSFKVMDYQLTPTSAAIDAANLTTATPQDFNGTTRGTAPDAGAYEFALGGEGTAPVATLNIATVTNAAWALTFSVTYSDNTAVDVASFSSSDIRVTSTNGFNQLAAFVSADVATNGTPRTATYQVLGPNGAWSSAASGYYAIAMEPSRVRDISGNFVPAGVLGGVSVAIGPGPGSFAYAFDFSRASGDRDWYFGERQPANNFDNNSSATNLIVASGGYLTASTSNSTWIVFNDPNPDVVDSSLPANATNLIAGANVIVRTRIENFSSGDSGQSAACGILFGLTGAGSTQSGFLARLERGANNNAAKLAVDRFSSGARGANLANSPNFTYSASGNLYFLDLRITSDNAATNVVFNLFGDSQIPGTGNNITRLTDAAFTSPSVVPSNTVSVTLANYTGGFLGLYFEDNSSTNASNPNKGSVRYSNFYAVSTNATAVARPLITGVRVVGGNVQIDFTGSASDAPAVFAPETAPAAAGVFATPLPVPSVGQISPGLFRLLVPTNGPTMFFRLKRLPQ